MVVDKFFDLVVKELRPLCHGWLRTEIHQEPDPSLEATNLVFGPAFVPGETGNAKFDQFLVVIPNEFLFALSSLAWIHIGNDVLSKILWPTPKTYNRDKSK